MILFAPGLELTISPRSFGFLYWKMMFRNQDLCGFSSCAHCCWGITAPEPSWWVGLRNTCMYNNLHMHSSTLLCLSILYVY